MSDDAPPPTFGTRLPRTLALGAAFLLLIVVALNTLSTPGTSSSGPAVGDPMPAFAAPLALSEVDGDVNVATRRDQGAAGAEPACELEGPGVVTSCELVRDRPAAIAFLAAGRERCEDQLDVLARAARETTGVQVAAVALRGNRDEVRTLVRERGWRFPVAFDRDAILANLYGVAVCPQITFMLQGGEVHDTVVGEQDAAQLRARLRTLTEASRRAGA